MDNASGPTQDKFAVVTPRGEPAIPVSDVSLCPMRMAFKNLIRKKRNNAVSLSSSREIDSPEAEASTRIAHEVFIILKSVNGY